MAPTIAARIRLTQTNFQRRERLTRVRRKARLAASLEKSGRFIVISLSSFPEPRQVDRTARPIASAQNSGTMSSLSFSLTLLRRICTRATRTFSGKAQARSGLCPDIMSPCGTRMVGEVAWINPHDLAFHHPYVGLPGPVHYSSRRGCESLADTTMMSGLHRKRHVPQRKLLAQRRLSTRQHTSVVTFWRLGGLVTNHSWGCRLHFLASSFP